MHLPAVRAGWSSLPYFRSGIGTLKQPLDQIGPCRQIGPPIDAQAQPEAAKMVVWEHLVAIWNPPSQQGGEFALHHGAHARKAESTCVCVSDRSALAFGGLSRATHSTSSHPIIQVSNVVDH